MTAEQTFSRVLFTLAMLSERAILAECAQAEAEQRAADDRERVRQISPVIANQVWRDGI